MYSITNAKAATDILRLVQSENPAAIYATIKAAPLAVSEIATRTGIERITVNTAIAKMQERGLVTRQMLHGVWVYAPNVALYAHVNFLQKEGFFDKIFFVLRSLSNPAVHEIVVQFNWYGNSQKTVNEIFESLWNTQKWRVNIAALLSPLVEHGVITKGTLGGGGLKAKSNLYTLLLNEVNYVSRQAELIITAANTVKTT